MLVHVLKSIPRLKRWRSKQLMRLLSSMNDYEKIVWTDVVFLYISPISVILKSHGLIRFANCFCHVSNLLLSSQILHLAYYFVAMQICKSYLSGIYLCVRWRWSTSVHRLDFRRFIQFMELQMLLIWNLIFGILFTIWSLLCIHLNELLKSRKKYSWNLTYALTMIAILQCVMVCASLKQY